MLYPLSYGRGGLGAGAVAPPATHPTAPAAPSKAAAAAGGPRVRLTPPGKAAC